jgi:hypothetical protein
LFLSWQQKGALPMLRKAKRHWWSRFARHTEAPISHAWVLILQRQPQVLKEWLVLFLGYLQDYSSHF